MKRVLLNENLNPARGKNDNNLSDPENDDDNWKNESSSTFHVSLRGYIHNNKPDSIQRKQIQSWKLTWENETTESMIVPASSLSFTPTNCLSGTLTWTDKYMSLKLYSICYWDGIPFETNDVSGEDSKSKSQCLYFSCRILNAEFVTTRIKTDDDEMLTLKERKANDKVHRKMIERLQNDAYIKKLLPPNSVIEELCEASVVYENNNNTTTKKLEERVHCSQEIAEAIRRSIFSTSDTPLDIFDLLLNYFPLLPQLKVADRARLRVLEDAMYDACELESDEVIVDDLQISTNNHATTGDNDDEDNGEQQYDEDDANKISKPSKKNNKNKKKKL